MRAAAWRELADTCAPPEPRAPICYGRLTMCDGTVMTARGFPYAVGQGAVIRDDQGHVTDAELVGFRGDTALLAPLGGSAALAPGAWVEPRAGGALAACGDALLGRIIDPMGAPIDGLGPIAADAQWPLAGKPHNALMRGRVERPFDSGVRAINAFATMGIGQRIALIAGSGVGKSVLMGQMVAGADVDRIVVGLIGERAREISDFVAERLSGDTRKRAVVVAVPADRAPILRLRAAMRASAIAEEYRSRGLRVLLLIDSLTRVAHAQREIGLALGEPPAMKAYPPSVFGLIPRLVERAGVDRASGGSITAVYTVLADGDDPDDPVVDAARAICDGHIMLTRALAEQAVFPAIDIARSLSRTMDDVVSAEHAAAARHARQLWSLYDANRDLMLMGALQSGVDPLIDSAFARRDDLIALIRQPQGARAGMAASVADLLAGFGGVAT
ncbi:MAG: FliI/YscN family ATPase [Pseudomonadota bacterium]